MRPNLDLLLTASTFKSPESAVRLAKSLSFIDGDCLLILTSPRMEDLSYIRSKIEGDNVMLFLSRIDNMYICRNWGFIYAYINGIFPKFYCSMDDDIEFTDQSQEIVNLLERDDYSVLTFDNRAQGYQNWGEKYQDGIKSMPWINGDSMFSHFEDNLQYGLPDCLLTGTGMPYFVESEYQKRLKILTNRPILVVIDKPYYIHHFRDNNAKVNMRSAASGANMSSGMDFIRKKYDIQRNLDANDRNFHPDLYNIMQKKGVSRHMLLYNSGDYHEIYNRIKGEYTQVFLGG